MYCYIFYYYYYYYYIIRRRLLRPERTFAHHARTVPTPTTPATYNIRIRDQKHEIPRQTFAFSLYDSWREQNKNSCKTRPIATKAPSPSGCNRHQQQERRYEHIRYRKALVYDCFQSSSAVVIDYSSNCTKSATSILTPSIRGKKRPRKSIAKATDTR